MQVDLFCYGGVPMADVGNGARVPTDRRYGNDDVVAGYERLAHWAETADRLGYDTLWLTEHHFQYEGYEVVPNTIMMGVALAGRTRRLRFGQMFTVVPQWHPLRLAEDFGMADVLTGGRMVFGVGRGTVPREAQTLGTVVASGDNEMSRAADRTNREVFEESMEVIKAAWSGERFSFSGKHFTFPPPGIPDRGSTVTHLTMIPRPLRPVPIYQPISSPATLEYCARVGHRGVFALRAPALTRPAWDRYAEVAVEHGRALGPGEERCLQLNVHVGRTREEAFVRVRDPHDEFCRFLAPYGRFTGYLAPDGRGRSPFGFQPTLEDSAGQRVMAIGSVDDVVDCIGEWRDLLGARHIALLPDFPGLTRDQVAEQLHLVAEEVMPRLGVRLPAA